MEGYASAYDVCNDRDVYTGSGVGDDFRGFVHTAVHDDINLFWVHDGRVCGMARIREMMALLGSLLGFGSSFLPEVLSYFKANQVQKHRMEMMQLETQLAQKRSEMKLVELDKQADIAETKGLYEHDRSIDAGGFINALRGSVRPVITYAFFGLFVATKVVIMVKVGQSGGDWTEAVELMWDPETAGLMSAVLAFWFGNRAISKYAAK